MVVTLTRDRGGPILTEDFRMEGEAPMKLLTTPTSIEREFLHHMREYSHYTWATAWASSTSPCFQELVQHRKKIHRIVVGTHFYQTHPDFIKQFLNSDVVRFVPKTDEMFHPKLYLFYNDSKDWGLIIGSANFTGAAFMENTEAVISLNAKDGDNAGVYDEALSLINRSWQGAEAFDSIKLSDYRRMWERQKGKLSALGGKYGKGKGKPLHKVAVVTMTWPEFFQKLSKSKTHSPQNGLKVLGIAEDCFRRLDKRDGSFNDLTELERKSVAGTLSYEQSMAAHKVDMRWFGSMTGAGMFNSAIINKNNDVSAALDEVPLTGEVTEAHFQKFIAHFKKVPKYGIATGTRLLAMKRPDYFVCLGSKNKSKLCEDFGLVESRITLEGYWDEICGRIQESIWWNAAEPKGKLDSAIWKRRAAFLDVLYYEE